MADPLGVSIAFESETLDTTPIWTRLDDPDGYRLAREWRIDRGRQNELEKTDTGRASVTFRDLGGLLDPTNSGGPFFTNLDPMKQAAIALQNPVTEEWSTLYRGFVSSGDHDLDMWTDERGLDTVTMEFADAFDLLAAVELTPGGHGHTPALARFADIYYHGTPSNLSGEADVEVHVDARINKLLDDAGWPEEWRDIFSGNVTVQGVVYDRTDQLLAALFDAADAEFPGIANVYVSKDGIVTFHGRYARFFPDRPGYGITTWDVGGMTQALADSNVAPIAGLRFRRSKDDILNVARALPAWVDDGDVPDAQVVDATSIGHYGYRSESFENLLTAAGHDDDLSQTTAVEETHKFADYYVGNYSAPKTRVTSIRFRPRGLEHPTAPALWALICGVEIGDVISLNTTHLGGGGFDDEEFYVEGIHYEATPMRDDILDVTLELDVSPASFFAYNPFGEVDEGVS